MGGLGFRGKITASISLLIIAYAAFFSIYFPRKQAEEASRALEDNAVTIASLLSSLTTPSVVIDELGGAEGALAGDLSTAGESDRDIAYLVVVKPDGSVLARYRAKNVNESIERVSPSESLVTERTGGHVHVRVPLVHEEKVVGTLVAGFSAAGVASARAASQRTALFVSVFILLTGVLIAWLISRSVSRPVLDAARTLDEVSLDLVATARQQEASSAEEAAAVIETRRSMETLLESAQQIADQSSEVLGNAERTALGSAAIGRRIVELNGLAETVAEFLAKIMRIADKADLLALNASLEGTKAGEAGKGFALVAAEMRRLAENVMEAVAGIRSLMKEMRDASQGATEASKEGNESSTATRESARKIARFTQQQRRSTEQVINSMDEMQGVLRETMRGVRRSTQSARAIASLAGDLSELVNPKTKRTDEEEITPANGDATAMLSSSGASPTEQAPPPND